MRRVVFQHLTSEVGEGRLRDTIYLFGRQENGQSICVHVPNYKPHITVKTNEKQKDFENKIQQQFSYLMKSDKFLSQKEGKWRRDEVEVIEQMDIQNDWLLCFEWNKGQDLCNYNEDGPIQFVTIRSDPKKFYKLKSMLKSKQEVVVNYNYNEEIFTGNKIPNDAIIEISKVKKHLVGPYDIYNDQVDMKLQYIIENNIYPCSWLECEYQRISKEKCITSCDMEVIAISIQQKEKTDMAPWRILTYDIESVPHPMGNGKFEFPSAQKDPVCTIGAVLQEGGKYKQYVWILDPREEGDKIDTLTQIERTDEYDPTETVVSYHFNEKKMLDAFGDFIIDEDIDILEGYNSDFFDAPYLIDRYHALTKSYPQWSRMNKVETTYKETVFQSNQAGKNITRTTKIPGRISHDGYIIMKKNHNLNSYKLDEVAKEFLGTKKYPMDYQEIYPKFHTREGRDELASYCVKDAWLTRKIMDKLSKLYVSFQLANVTGVELKDILNRGQGIRTIALMLRYCKRRNPPYFIPRRENKKKYVKKRKFVDNDGVAELSVENEEVQQGFKGAVVLDPKPKFYKNAVATLDFASLYPSIVQCMNMCYSTIIPRETMKLLKWTEGKEVRTVPDYYWEDGRMKTQINYNTNVIFATKETRKGILPEILDSLLAERRRVKKIMKQHYPDTVAYKIANGRQLGLKVCANSVYGFTGATVGFLPEMRIAGSVTKYGRGLTLQTQDLIENHPVWGKEHGVKCVYGDTDSVFCHLPRSLCDGKTPEETVKRAEEIGKEMGEYVDKHFLRPVELEFEKVYLPFLLLKKKRYCGKKYEEGHVKIDMKGLECVRRDFCPLLVDTQKKMLKTLMNTMDTQKSCEIVQQAIQDLMMNKIPLAKLTMSKKLSRSPEEYKVKAVHVHLAERINKERGVGHGFVAGERVPYVIAKGQSRKMSENGVLPEEIESGKYVVDLDYYRENQLIPPLKRILEKICNDPRSLFAFHRVCKPKVTGVFASWVRKENEEPKYEAKKRKVEKKTKTKLLASFFIK